MKNIICIFLVLLFASLTAIAQDGIPLDEPPQKVGEGLNLKYKGEKLVFSWRKVGDWHIAVFQHDGGYKYCALDYKGFWQEAGVQINTEDVPETVMNAVPELDMTAFIVEVFQSSSIQDHKGFTFLYETDVDRIELFITNEGEIIRQNKYPIPKENEEEDKDGKEEDDWR